MSENKCEVCQKTLVLEEENICAECGLKESKVENINDVSCGICNNIVEEDSEGITCDRCNCWYHNDCCESPLTEDLYSLLNTAPNNVKWFCDKCIWKTEKWIHRYTRNNINNALQDNYDPTKEHELNDEIQNDAIDLQDSQSSDDSDGWIPDDDDEGVPGDEATDNETDTDYNETNPQSQEDILESEVDKASKSQCENIKIKTRDWSIKRVDRGRHERNSTNYALRGHTYDQTKEPEVYLEIENEAIDFQDSQSSYSDDCVSDDYEYDENPKRQRKPKQSKSKPQRRYKRQRFICDLCQKICYGEDNFDAHKLWHSGDKKPYKCTVCDGSFAHKSLLKTHSIIHSDNKPFLCDICDKGFKRKNRLREHQREMHSSEKPHVCGKCGKGFNRRGHLRSHIQSVHKLTDVNGLFPCTKCEAKYSRKGDLTKHMRQGNHIFGLKNPKRAESRQTQAFPCTKCNAKYYEKGHLDIHMKYHSGEGALGERPSAIVKAKLPTTTEPNRTQTKIVKPQCPEYPKKTQIFPCTKCNAKYYMKAHLDKHMKHHTGKSSSSCTQTKTMKPQCPEDRQIQVFPCTKCDAKYDKKVQLTNHMRHHTGECPEYEQTQIKPKATTSQQHHQDPATAIQSIAAPQSCQNPPPLLYTGVPNNNSYYSGGVITPSYITIQEQTTFF